MRIYYDSYDKAQALLEGKKLPLCVWDHLKMMHHESQFPAWYIGIIYFAQFSIYYPTLTPIIVISVIAGMTINALRIIALVFIDLYQQNETIRRRNMRLRNNEIDKMQAKGICEKLDPDAWHYWRSLRKAFLRAQSS